MKANKFFLGLALIGAILTGCEKDKTGNQGNYDTTSYMSVSIAQAGGTRAIGDYIDGTEMESKVKTVDFYFYDSDGNAFEFSAAQNGGGASYTSNRYHYSVTPEHTPTQGTNQNVDEVLDAQLVIQHNKGNIPAYMIAVINSTKDYSYTKNVATTFQQLAAVKSDILATGVNDDQTHIMTNSVYMLGGNIVMETPIAVENLAITADKAKAAPVKIYVERVSARVEFDKKSTLSSNVVVVKNADESEYKVKYVDGSESSVYANIQGWGIVTYANEGTLAKSILTSWGETAEINGFLWNKPVDYRSYWANAEKTASELTKTFKWNTLTNSVGNVDYCLENTTKPVVDRTKPLVLADDSQKEDLDVSRTNVTKVVVKAQLCSDAAGNTPLTIVNWYGSNYKSVADLKVAVAQSLKNKLNYVEAGVYKQIEPAHIAIVENVAETQKSYEVYFQLATGAPSEWFANENGEYKSVSDANAVLKGVANAKVWTNGMAYYIVNIKHLGSVEKTGDELESVYNSAYYGVVRNHAYEVTFNGVVGLGTPVYSATTEYPEPVTPDFTDSYVAAEINVLAWHLVQQEVTLQ